jgi:hypothetical protein
MQLPPMPNLAGMDPAIREALQTLWRAVQSVSSGLTPGSVLFSAEQPDKIKDPWLVCDGRAVSRRTYKPLFDRIGTQYGAGDGSTSFNVPDLGCRWFIGYEFGGAGPAAEELVSGYMATYEVDNTLAGAHMQIDVVWYTPIILGR